MITSVFTMCFTSLLSALFYKLQLKNLRKGEGDQAVSAWWRLRDWLFEFKYQLNMALEPAEIVETESPSRWEHAARTIARIVL